MADSLIATHVRFFVSTFNRVRHLQLAVKGVLSQSYCNLDIIVIDYGSTDESAAVVTSISNSRIERSVNYSWNNGLGVCNRLRNCRKDRTYAKRI
jgi:glycosyltransferase involved in cell wall biosynthesis